MTIKEVAQQTGLSPQAIYKKIKSRGIKIEELKSKETGQLTEYGEAVINELFFKSKDEKQVDNVVDKSTFEINKLTTEIQLLRSRVESLEAVNSILSQQCDDLKKALNQAQQLQLMTLSRIPALPAPEQHGIKGWFARRREKKTETS